MIETLSITIRQAVIDDTEAILTLIEEFYKESLKEYGLSFKVKTLIDTIFNIITNQIGLVAEKDEKIIGCVGGIVTNSMFDKDQKIAQETIWYVIKEERQGTVGIRLLKAFEQECVRRGAKFILMIYMNNLLSDELRKFYEKRGYKQLENHFIRGV